MDEIEDKKIPIIGIGIAVVLLIIIIIGIIFFTKKEEKKYNVTYNANMFSANFTRRTTESAVSGDKVKYLFDYETSYLTINGIPTTGTSIGYNVRTFESGEQYKVTLTYVSGSIKENDSYAFVTEVYNSKFSKLSTRNYLSITFPTSGSKTSILTISSTGASEGKVLENHMYLASSGAVEFDNYVVKVEITKVESEELESGDNYNLPSTEPTRTGFTFDGWYTEPTGGTKVTSDTKMNENADHTLYARWTAKTITINYDANGGSGTMENTLLAYGDNVGESGDGDITLPKNTYTRTGYKFTGWRIYNPTNGWWYGCTDNAKCSGATNTTIGWHDASDITTYYRTSQGAGFNQSHSGEDMIFYAQWEEIQ